MHGIQLVPVSSFGPDHKFEKVSFGSFISDGISGRPGEKHGSHQKLILRCREVLSLPEMSLRNLCSLSGKLRATAPAVSPAPSQVRFLQQLCIEAETQKLHYESMIPLSRDGRLEIKWCSSHRQS